MVPGGWGDGQLEEGQSWGDNAELSGEAVCACGGGLGEELSGSTAGGARRARSAVRTDRQWHWRGRWEGQGREERREPVSSRAGGQRGDGQCPVYKCQTGRDGLLPGTVGGHKHDFILRHSILFK